MQLDSAVESITRISSNTNFAVETSNLTRAQIRSQAGTSVLATANSTPQSVLTLLQGR